MSRKLTTNKYHNIHMLDVDEVVDLDSLIDFLNSRCGSPIPTKKDKGVVSKMAKDFFESYPDADWRCLTDLATWAKVRNKHLSMDRLVCSWRYAYQDGFMLLLQRGGSTNDDATLALMLQNVNDQAIRDQLTCAATSTARDEIYKAFLDTSEKVGINAGSEVDDTPDPLTDYGLKTGQTIKVRMSASDNPEYGTVVRLSDDDRLIVYIRGRELPVEFDLVYIRRGKEWECLL